MDVLIVILRKASYSKHPIDLAANLMAMEFDEQKLKTLFEDSEANNILQLFFHRNRKLLHNSISDMYDYLSNQNLHKNPKQILSLIHI